MSDLMNLIDKLREATSSAKKECDLQINKTLDIMSKDLKNKIINHRDSQIKAMQQDSNGSEYDLEKLKKNLTDNIDEFNILKSKIANFFQDHLLIKQKHEEKINSLSIDYKRNRTKQCNISFIILSDRMNHHELTRLELRLKKNAILVMTQVIIDQKMKSCLSKMMKPDETLVKIHKMLNSDEI